MFSNEALLRVLGWAWIALSLLLISAAAITMLDDSPPAALQVFSGRLCGLAPRWTLFVAHNLACLSGAIGAAGLLLLTLARFGSRGGISGQVFILALAAPMLLLPALQGRGPNSPVLLGAYAGLVVALLGLAREAKYVPGVTLPPMSAFSLPGRLVLSAWSLGTLFGGVLIASVATGAIFVPEDLDYLGISVGQPLPVAAGILEAIRTDRAGFGGWLVVVGLLGLGVVWGTPSEARRPALRGLCLAGAWQLGTALGSHVPAGYLSLWHLAPFIALGVLLTAGVTIEVWAGISRIRATPPPCP